jgi:Universal stress protein family
MSPPTVLPDRNVVPTQRPGHSAAGAHDLAAAIARELRRRASDPPLSDAGGGLRLVELGSGGSPGHCAGAVLVPGTAPVPARGAVAAAVDDDASCGMVTRHAGAEARRLAVPLRVVHVWTGAGASAAGARLPRHDRMCDADQLLAAVLYENLPEAEAGIAEREILHDPEPARALAALSATLSLLVVAARAVATGRGTVLGGTARGLVGRTACPLVVVPATAESAIW